MSSEACSPGKCVNELLAQVCTHSLARERCCLNSRALLSSGECMRIKDLIVGVSLGRETSKVEQSCLLTVVQ